MAYAGGIGTSCAGYGGMGSAAILVLFILLVIISLTFSW
ncbi:sporulation protein YjcZ [Paenibacillus sp. N3.4]|nr:sporulation protein YjcZ [Paenibacillus sp. N3.4]